MAVSLDPAQNTTQQHLLGPWSASPRQL
ncbi:hypothetical protein RDI58_023264 [Solanum bulbocastanum]|uniref:Uncharacterized protein n=1 Tax=Solanum bulbocastanum TaxID=147425 RepID=A0AAN8T5L3_SOLBU